jgi:PAS domain-containing protein
VRGGFIFLGHKFWRRASAFGGSPSNPSSAGGGLNGAIVWARLTVGCVRKSDGSVDYLVTVEDITARKQAEEDLRKSEEQFRSSLLRSPLPVLLYDEREQILAVSQSWLEKPAIRGRSCTDSRTGQREPIGNARAKYWSTFAGSFRWRFRRTWLK